MSRDGDFWARRKAAVAAEATAEVQAEEQAVLAAAHAELEEKPDSEILAELELPDPDTLKQGDDFTVFLAKAVPERIRRRALRKLWLSNPVLANVDALVDYGEDFTDSALVVDGLQTAYQVGKGMLKHVEEMARQAEAKAAAEDAIVSDIDEEDDTLSLAEDEEVTEAVEPLEEQAIHTLEVEVDPDVDTPAAVPVRRRLRFEFAASDTPDQRDPL
ncbi:hypothetical protein NBRC116594_19410 [Shimia sp. NS0008-38b]|uniref:DUF3306 domain-containing protein n=1 Tax=Shimia sp. NS0008-38b TaxID=3127653 RepID=UPI00310A1A10